MKRCLLIFMGVLSLFFFSDSVSALSFTAENGAEYVVDSEEKLLDYCYYTYVKNSENIIYNFSLTKTSTGHYKFIFYDSDFNVSFYNNSTFYLYNGTTRQTYTYYLFKSNFDFSSSASSSNTDVKSIIYSTHNIYTSSAFETIAFTANTTVEDIESRYVVIPKYTITYYVNNEVYQTIEVEKGSSHELLTYEYNQNTHNFSGWQYDNSIDLNNISSNITISATLTEKIFYTITYYINNEVYKTIEVEKGTNHSLLEYIPLENYNFSGWQYDENVDLTNITSSINIYGTSTYIGSDSDYTESIDSIIHDLSVSIIGDDVPIEFDYVYIIMDFILLLVLIFCVIMPFVLIIKLLSGRW